MCYRSVDIMPAVIIDEGLITHHFAPHRVFRTDRSIKPGEQFKDVLKRAVRCAQAMVMIVGKNWSSSLAAGNHRWAFEEILQAQDNSIPILPVVLTRYMAGGSPTWEPVERPLEQLSADTLPPGIDRSLLDTEPVTVGTINPRRDIANVAAALTRLVPEQVLKG
jgi:hypothetical protein